MDHDISGNKLAKFYMQVTHSTLGLQVNNTATPNLTRYTSP